MVTLMHYYLEWYGNTHALLPRMVWEHSCSITWNGMVTLIQYYLEWYGNTHPVLPRMVW